METPSIGPLLVAFFICILSFANFETTLSLLLKGKTEAAPFHFSLEEVGLDVRLHRHDADVCPRSAGPPYGGPRFRGVLASAGAVLDMLGFLLLLHGDRLGRHNWLLSRWRWWWSASPS